MSSAVPGRCGTAASPFLRSLVRTDVLGETAWLAMNGTRDSLRSDAQDEGSHCALSRLPRVAAGEAASP